MPLRFVIRTVESLSPSFSTETVSLRNPGRGHCQRLSKGSTEKNITFHIGKGWLSKIMEGEGRACNQWDLSFHIFMWDSWKIKKKLSEDFKKELGNELMGVMSFLCQVAG